MISDTALCVLDLRATCSDIKYAAEIAALVNAEAGQERLVGPENVPKIREAFGAWAELRHRAIEAALNLDGGTDFLLDVAAGFGLRGLILTEHPGKFCVEADLPEMTKHKRNAVELLSGGVLRPNHRVMEFDALKTSDWRRAYNLFPLSARITIVIEGLLVYFTMEQKRQVLREVSLLLTRYANGSRFISPDFYTVEEMQNSSEISSTFRKSVEEKVGMDFRSNAFASANDILAMSYECGFSHVRMVPASELYPIERLKQQPEGAPRQFLRNQQMVIASL